jgi:predicted MFS family arabinose efflux permease
MTVQALDGVSAAAFGVMLPLIAADITRGTNRFNLCMGVLGLAVGAGATISTELAGSLSTQFGDATAFLALAAAGMASIAVVALGMPPRHHRQAVRVG